MKVLINQQCRGKYHKERRELMIQYAKKYHPEWLEKRDPQFEFYIEDTKSITEFFNNQMKIPPEFNKIYQDNFLDLLAD